MEASIQCMSEDKALVILYVRLTFHSCFSVPHVENLPPWVLIVRRASHILRGLYGDTVPDTVPLTVPDTVLLTGTATYPPLAFF